MPPDCRRFEPCQHEILVVDDDPLFLEVALICLRDAGFDVVGARNGCEAMAGLAFRPAVLILDCGLAGTSELSIMDEVARTSPSTKVVILSARRSPFHHNVMLSFGADLVLTKPIGRVDLERAVTELMLGTLREA